MPSMGGSATLISAPHLGDLLDVDMSGRTDQCLLSWQAGSAKYEPLPGVRGAGVGSLTVDSELGVGPSELAISPTYTRVAGQLFTDGTQGVYLDGGEASYIYQYAVLDGVHALPPTQTIYRGADRTAGGPIGPVQRVVAGVAFATPEPDWGEILWAGNAVGQDRAQINAAGGIGLFQVTPPTIQPAITGALSTVADAPAKAVLTSIIAALVGCGLASDGTT